MSAKLQKSGQASGDGAYGEAMTDLSELDRLFREDADPKDREKIDAITVSYGLPAGAGYFINHALKGLRQADDWRQEYPFTSSERASALQAVAESCVSLTRALSRVFATAQDADELERIYGEIATKRASITIVQQGDWRAICSTLAVFLSSASACGAAALTARESIPEYGKTGGRRPVQDSFAKQIEELFYACLPSGIVPGRGGEFDRLCKEVWELAGMPATHEGPLRHFLKERWPELKKRVLAGDFGVIPVDRKKPRKKRAG